MSIVFRIMLVVVCWCAGAHAFADVTVWNDGNGHAYAFVPGEFTWQEAEADAATRTYRGVTGHLVTITSREEQDFIVQLIADAGAGASLFWMGASDVEEEGVWRWVAGPETGEVFYTTADGAIGYADWAPGEPNDQFGNENCALGNWGAEGSWNDGGCDSRLGYVVEFSVDRPIECETADFNSDSVVGLADWTDFRAAFLLGDVSADIDGNGLINGDDVWTFFDAFSVCICWHADITGNGVFDAADIALFLGGFPTDPIADLDGDGNVGLSDWLVFLVALQICG